MFKSSFLLAGLCMQSCGMPSELDAPEDGGDGYDCVSCDGRTGGMSTDDGE
jgi:hypothetical protein